MMIRSRMLRVAFGLGIATALVSGCGAPSSESVPLLSSSSAHVVKPQAAQAIQNVIVIVQQHRSFDNVFAGFRGADAPMYGLEHNGKRVSLRPIRLESVPSCGDGEFSNYFDTVYNKGQMNGWDLVDAKDPTCPYTRIVRNEVKPYWDLAKRYALADHMFASTRYESFVDSIYLVAGTTKLQANTYAAGAPSKEPWGCDAPAGTTTPILKNGKIELGGPFPCFTQFPTIADLLDKAGVGWNVYTDRPTSSLPFDPFEAMKAVREGPDWTADTSSPASNVLNDLDSGALRPVSFVLSPVRDSDYPGNGGGPKWVQRIVEHAQKSRYWQHLAIVVVWDDFGNGSFYDNVPPAILDPMGLGFRVPLLVISPAVKHGYISRTQYEYGSILKFIEVNWNLGTLRATDERATSIRDMFDR
ncbi:MAG TPA: alkaline phosphatase family protein [Candidatus Tumulicola sp.]|jgi:phospholipase C